MCGRYAATKDPATIAREFDALDEVTDTEAAPGPSYNVAPTRPVTTVVRRHPRAEDGTVLTTEAASRRVRGMVWGLVPSWAKDPSIGQRMINARAETVATKPAFRKAVARRRCLVPADGWFEWLRGSGEGRRPAKQPYYMTARDGTSLAFAGIWETWRDPELPSTASPTVTCSVLTTDAVGALADIHHRMPLLMPPHLWDEWLDPDSGDVAELLAPPAADVVERLEIRPVSERVGNVRNNGPELIERIDVDGAQQRAQQHAQQQVPLFDTGGTGMP
ncbi:SOS response-associated peptidase [Haloechinothrix sp. YIM 98757]|uniref:Abasic site processing protein n=1 Tax=Haloechinothrix aidingensis TaxID=2752311 RepID=A0A838A9I2_9PSEU|nr:SOS response-associated peptidase [Haloechinothrix aidingensis]MBA0125359.1 SOS response-associated peptidase [Haloechinothrix aidingensis]